MTAAVDGPAKFASWEQAVAWLREQPEQRRLVLDSYYDDPLADAAHRYWQSEEWKQIVPYLGAGRGRAIDIGAGRGIASYALAREGFTVTALEPDASDLVGGGAIRALAKATALPIDVAQGFSEAIPLADGCADFVFARATLHHTQDLKKACREFFRLLRPGGRLLAVREHVISQPGQLGAFLDAHPLHHIYGGENAFLLDEYLRALRAAGFKVVETLSPLASAINYAPQTLETLRQEIASRTAAVPGAPAAIRLALKRDGALRAALKLLALLDNRPGRLYSFVCDKPLAR